jgi:hypothetical protein
MSRALSIGFLSASLILGACVSNHGFEPPANDAGGGVEAAASDAGAGADSTPEFGDSSVEASNTSPANLVQNGNFELGNKFFGSDYGYISTPNGLGEGDYTVGPNPQTTNISLIDAGDHTSGTGQMFIGNGKDTPDNVWTTSTSISVIPNTKYYFEAWVMNLCCKVGSGYGDGIHPLGPSVLSFYANGQLLGTRTSTQLGVWEGLSTTWSSGSATVVDLKLVNANTDSQGNDFAVDDVYLGTESTVIH